MPSPREGVASRKEELEVRRDLEIPSQIEHCEGTDIVAALPLRKKLPAQGQSLAEIALQEPSAKAVIALSGGRIDNVAASPVGRPWSPTLLQPHWQPLPCPAIPQTAASITRGNFEHGEDPYHWAMVSFLNKAIF